MANLSVHTNTNQIKIDYDDNISNTHALNKHFDWSLQNLRNKDNLIRERRALSLKLTGLPLNTTHTELKNLLKKINTKSFVIPKSKNKRIPLKHAFINFENRDDKLYAKEQIFILRNKTLIWTFSDHKTCHKCGSDEHLVARCTTNIPKKKLESKVEECNLGNETTSTHLKKLIICLEMKTKYDIDKWNEMEMLMKSQYDIIKKKQNDLHEEVKSFQSDLTKIKRELQKLPLTMDMINRKFKEDFKESMAQLDDKIDLLTHLPTNESIPEKVQIREETQAIEIIDSVNDDQACSSKKPKGNKNKQKEHKTKSKSKNKKSKKKKKQQQKRILRTIRTKLILILKSRMRY